MKTSLTKCLLRTKEASKTKNSKTPNKMFQKKELKTPNPKQKPKVEITECILGKEE